MNTNTLLLSVNDLKNNTPIDLNVDDNTISDVENADYKTLIDDWVWPLQIKFALYRAIMPMRVSFRNKGLMENTSENSTPVDKEFVTFIEHRVKNDIEFYSNKLKGYLCWFFEQYPDDKCDKPDFRNDYTEPNQKDSYNSGIYLG